MGHIGGIHKIHICVQRVDIEIGAQSGCEKAKRNETNKQE